MMFARTICLTLERPAIALAEALAWAKTGNRIAARIAMIAMTTRSSMSVKARRSIGRGLLAAVEPRSMGNRWEEPRPNGAEASIGGRGLRAKVYAGHVSILG